MVPKVEKHCLMPEWWRWVLLGATLYMNCIVNGYTYCFGLVKFPLLDEYPEVSPMMLALVGGAIPSIYMFLAPPAIALSEYFGICYTTMFASALSALCFFLAWANGVVLHWGFGFDFLCLGIGQGVAFSLLYGPSVACLPQYFRIDQLGFAAGITNAGSSIGVIIYGFISNPLFAEYGWRGTLLFYSLISLHGLIAGIIFMPSVARWAKQPDVVAVEAVDSQSFILEESKPLRQPQTPKVKFLPLLKKYFDLNLFKQWPFICLMCAAGFSIVGYFVPMLLLPGHARIPEYGVSRVVAKNVMAVFGILNLVGLIAVGKIGDLGLRYVIFSAFWLYIASLVSSAVCFLLLPWLMVFGDAIFMGFAVLYGFCAAPIITMRSLLTITLFGKKNANASYGWFLCAQGGLQMIGYILPAWIDMLGSVYPYMFAAFTFLFAAFCCGITMRTYFQERQKQIDELASNS